MRIHRTRHDRRIMREIRKFARLYDISVRFATGYQVRAPDGMLVDGFFDPPHKNKKGRLVIGGSRRERWYWISTVAHEFAHLLYWVFRGYQPGRSYFEQEFHAEILADRLLAHWGVHKTIRTAHRRNASTYLAWTLKTYSGKKRQIRNLHHAQLRLSM